MNKNAIIDMLNIIKKKTAVLKLHNQKDLILLMLYLYDWKFVLVKGYSSLNIDWKLINFKVTFIEFNSLLDESNYTDTICSENNKYDAIQIFKFISAKLDKYNIYQNLLGLVNSTYPIASKNNVRNSSLNLITLAAEYKSDLSDAKLHDVTNTETSFFSKIISLYQHYTHRIMRLNFKNTKYLELLIDELKNDIKLYKYDFNTGLLTRHDMIVRLELLEENYLDIGFIMYDINGLHEINRLEGMLSGDNLIKLVSDDIKNLMGDHITYTTGGDEFFVIYEDINQIPDNINVANTTSAIVYSEDFNTYLDMINSVDLLVSNKKKLNKRRRNDI